MSKNLMPFDADWGMEGIDVEANWRYPLILPYITQSPSFIAVTNQRKGLKVSKDQLPKDRKLVYEIADKFNLLDVEFGFDDFFNIRWWQQTGKFLYGTKHAIPDVEQTLIKAGESAQIAVNERSAPTIALQIPTTLTSTEAISRIRDIFYIYNAMFDVKFGVPLPAMYDAQFKLLPNKFRKDTLVKGVDALTMYRNGMPLWEIGNTLKICPGKLIKGDGTSLDQDDLAHRKQVLSIMALRLVKTALLIAENAARGRFPLDKPFPEAIIKSYKRAAGRPVGSKRPKRISVTQFKSF